VQEIKGSEIWRGGLFADSITHEEFLDDQGITPKYVKIYAGHPTIGTNKEGLYIMTLIRSKGGGSIQVYAFIPKSEYNMIRKIMGDDVQ
jgi:hypothetical protein